MHVKLEGSPITGAYYVVWHSGLERERERERERTRELYLDHQTLHWIDATGSHVLFIESYSSRITRMFTLYVS